MLPEIPLQIDLFTGALVDTRTREQKRLDELLHIPQQLLMFPQREIAQFGVSAHPVMPLSPGKLHLISEDPRTDEEVERDLQREAEKSTLSLFAEASTQTVEVSRPTPELALPLLSLTKGDLLKRRPDLQAQIERLDEDELSFLAGKVSEALHEPYQMLLGLVLSLYLDQELRLMLKVKPREA